MALSEKRKGEGLVFVSSFLWSFFPIVVILSYAALPSMHSLAWSTLSAAIFFGIVVVVRKKWEELKDPLLWRYGFLIALFLGILFYVFVFFGLKFTTPGNAAILGQFQILTSFLLFNVLRKEGYSLENILGSILMVIGTGIVLANGFSGIHIGDLFILASTLFAPLGNLYQQKARQIASSETIMFLRSLLSVSPLFLFAYLLQGSVPFSAVQAALPFILTIGVLLLGIQKTIWIEVVHRLPATKAVALDSMNPFFTLLFAWIILAQVPTIWQLYALVPIILGVLFLTDYLKLPRGYDRNEAPLA